MSRIDWVLLAAVCALLSTGVGGLASLFRFSLKPSVIAGMLGFAAGIMMSASYLSLFIPSMDLSEAAGFSLSFHVFLPILLGGLSVLVAERFIPHEHEMQGREGVGKLSVHRAWLLFWAVAIHNFPEGVAVGTAFGADELRYGLSILIGISLQNIPEGLIAAVSMRAAGYSLGRALSFGLVTGLVEAIGVLCGFSFVESFTYFLPAALAFAGGAMIFVVAKEVIPESYRSGAERVASVSFLVGALLMIVFDRMIAA